MFTQTAIKNSQKIHSHLLFEYDHVSGANIKMMPSRLNGRQEAVQDWATQTLEVETTEIPVLRVIPRLLSGFYILNETMHFGRDQQLLVCRQGYWLWKPTWKIKQGDLLWSTDGEIVINSNEFSKKMITLPEIVTEVDDVCFLNRTLVHTGGFNGWIN